MYAELPVVAVNGTAGVASAKLVAFSLIAIPLRTKISCLLNEHNRELSWFIQIKIKK
jgi:hypothetical protein